MGNSKGNSVLKNLVGYVKVEPSPAKEATTKKDTFIHKDINVKHLDHWNKSYVLKE